MKTIKDYCKTYNLKFEKLTKNGFVASKLISLKAGMAKDLHSGKTLFYDIKTISKKRVYRDFLCYADGDIVDNGIVNLS